jgi:hypothetical protein
MNITDTKLDSLAERLDKALRPISEQLTQLGVQFQKFADRWVVINRLNQLAWSRVNENIRKGLKQTKEALEKAEILGTLGWTVPMGATPAEYLALINSIIDIPSADKAFTNYYTESNSFRLKYLKKDLLNRKNVQPWKPAIEEAISDLEDNRYRSCIALLLPLIDGITAIKFSSPQFYKKVVRRNFFEARLRAARPDSLTQYMWRSYRGFAKMLFFSSDFKRSSRKPSGLNRHWLLHGRDIPNSNPTDCFRLLQALDMILELQ